MTDIYTPEAASDFYDELLVVPTLPDGNAIYRIMNMVFHRFIDQMTSETTINLCGTFAKTDYLLKEHEADKALSIAVNTTRNRLRHHCEMSDDEKARLWRYDLKHICKFIAFVSGKEIPEELAKQLPHDEEQREQRQLITDSLRVIIDHWDDSFVFCRAEQTDDTHLLKVDYVHGSKAYPFDWSYLKELFVEGAQMNLIRPRREQDTIQPELIIFEPDYLVDISTISRCFASYAESPVVGVINRLMHQQSSEAIVLGNFAGQLLDEEIHLSPSPSPTERVATLPHSAKTRTYVDSVMDFFKDHAVSLVTTELSQDFHANAQQQQRNIAKAMQNDLPKTLSRFDIREGIVEPSFFSEMLGLQGRMDYLQLDMKVLLEQKSGKGGFPYDGFHIPRHREEHYVQLLLYMLLIRYNYRHTYEQNNHELHAFLLYSKYEQSLLGMGFAPELIFRALKVRNKLTAREIGYAMKGGYDFLSDLTLNDVNEKHAKGKLWEQYTAPQILSVLLPIKNATPLERAYFLRFMSFIACEHLLSKIGNKTKENSGFASKWHDTLEEKLGAGNIYAGLELDHRDLSPRPIENVTLTFAETDDNDMSNFRKGDIVILYPYAEGTEPDVRKTMVFRCSIADIQPDTITLKLRARQTDDRVFAHYDGMLWAIEHDFIEASFSSLYRAMHTFLTAPKERRDLLMLQREPEVSQQQRLKGDYGAFNELALHVRQAQDFFIIIGPPGTGKTSYGLLTTLKEQLMEAEASVLLMSYTNRAVDEVCSKLVAEGIDFIRLGSELSCAEEYKKYLIGEQVQKCRTVNELKDRLLQARVVVGTTTALNSNIALLEMRHFTLAIIDEASQILEPHLIGLLCAQCDGEASIRKFVMIGDHKQLPAVVQQSQEESRVDDTLLNDILLTDCRLSLFERLLRRYADNPEVTYLLNKQGRMHRDIAAFPNQAFYNGKLTEVPLPHQVAEDDGFMPRLAFIDAPLPAATQQGSKVNNVEAEIIAKQVKAIYEHEGDAFDVNNTIGIIVPYRNQIATIRNLIDKMGIPELHDISIDTVERFQGSQRQYIIYGFTVQKRYQLKFLTDNVFIDHDGTIVDRKLNVAMTRAKEHLIIVGNAALLSNITTFKNLIDYCTKQ